VNTSNTTDTLHHARAVRATQARSRAAFLIEVNEKRGPTAANLPWVVAEPGHEHLLPMSVLTFLRNAPGWGDRKARRLMASLIAMLSDADHDPLAPRKGKTRAPQARRKPTLAWLIDSRAQGRRVLDWLSLTQPRQPPWPGWPIAPDPHRRNT
jgi:hypothetical protein